MVATLVDNETLFTSISIRFHPISTYKNQVILLGSFHELNKYICFVKKNPLKVVVGFSLIVIVLYFFFTHKNYTTQMRSRAEIIFQIKEDILALDAHCRAITFLDEQILSLLPFNSLQFNQTFVFPYNFQGLVLNYTFIRVKLNEFKEKMKDLLESSAVEQLTDMQNILSLGTQVKDSLRTSSSLIIALKQYLKMLTDQLKITSSFFQED